MDVLQESPTHPLSERSTAAIANSAFHATDFILGAGVVIIQPSTSKIVLVTDKRERWFLLKGGKIRESPLNRPPCAKLTKRLRKYLPGGNKRPFRRASVYTVESAALPSQPLNTYLNFMSKSHTASTFCETLPFLFQYRATASVRNVSAWEPSIAPRQYLKYGKKR